MGAFHDKFVQILQMLPNCTKNHIWCKTIESIGIKGGKGFQIVDICVVIVLNVELQHHQKNFFGYVFV